jgi:hypothetical protein
MNSSSRFSMALSEHGDKSHRVVPVTEFFTHVREMRQFVSALVSSGKVHENFELARGHFARGIERRLSELPHGAGDCCGTTFSHRVHSCGRIDIAVERGGSITECVNRPNRWTSCITEWSGLVLDPRTNLGRL